MVLTLVRASLFSNIPRLYVQFSLVYILFSIFGTAHALCFAPAPCAGDPFSLPHVWLDFFVYTYKFTFDYCIITTQMSFLYALWCHPFRWFLTTSDDFRRLPNTSDDTRRLPTMTRTSLSDISDFQFNGTSLTLGKPSPPIRGLERQSNSFASQCVLYRPPMLLQPLKCGWSV